MPYTHDVPQFTQIAAAANPNGAGPALFAIDEMGHVWQYISTPKNGPPYWLPLTNERKDP